MEHRPIYREGRQGDRGPRPPTSKNGGGGQIPK